MIELKGRQTVIDGETVDGRPNRIVRELRKAKLRRKRAVSDVERDDRCESSDEK